MTDQDDFRKALLYEQFGLPVKEWFPGSRQRNAEKARIREIEEQEQHRDDTRSAS